MPKDVQGIVRGKCNSCECEEYYPPPDGKGLRCEYCDHVPGCHVRIIELGACKKCGEDNCDKYVPEELTSYSECQYCGCEASHHKGAEALRKPTQAPQGGPAPSTQPFTGPPPGTQPFTGPPSGTQPFTGPAATGSMPFQPRVLPTGQAVQTSAFGSCAFPGCPYPKRVEGNRVHDYCSRTCAKKHTEQKAHTAPPHPGQMTSIPSAPQPQTQQVFTVRRTAILVAQQQPPPKTSPPTIERVQNSPPGAVPLPSNAGPPPSNVPVQLPGNLCKKCNVHTANPGRSWCQSCFQNKS